MLRCRTACCLSLHYAGVKADSVINVLAKVVSKLFVVLKRESFKGAALFNAGVNESACYLIGISERHTLLNKIVSAVCSIDKSLSCGISHVLWDNSHCSKHRVERFKTKFNSVDSVKDSLLVLLHILVVCKRQTLHHYKQCVKVAVNSACLSSYKLSNIRVFLLWHDRRACCVSVVKLDKFELP